MQHGLPDLESALATSDLYDYRTVDWPRVQQSAYVIHQHLQYDYPGPIENLQQRLMILPPAQHGNQRLIDHRLLISTPSIPAVYRVDSFGNTEISLSVPLVEQVVSFEAWILVERKANAEPHYLSMPQLVSEQYLQPSRLTMPDERLARTAAQFMAEGKQGRELAQQINTWVYEAMDYVHDVTDIHTTAAEALALKQGVCQDYAHIMVALCRLCALPARYVSGHLLGEGGTHAWVEVLLPVDEKPDLALVLPLDPTHGRAVGLDYVTIAVGSDYADVAPTSGTYRAAYPGRLSTHKQVGLTMYQYATDTN